MGLTNEQYNEIIRSYDQLRLEDVHDRDRRVAEVYEKVPAIQDIQNRIVEISIRQAKAKLLPAEEQQAFNYQKQLHALSETKAKLLKEHGFAEDYLSMRYHCRECQDTGYKEHEMCSCMRAKIIQILYEQSNLKELVDKENFSTFRTDLYPDDLIDKNTGLSARQNIIDTLNTCREFVNNFHEGSQNLFIYGAAGVGKTFLINCIAKELIDSSCSVIYMSAVRFFEVLADASFNKGVNLSTYESTVQRDLYDCDLLIIDDLGTEVANSFTASALFQCINERFNRKKSVIISTNLPLSSLRDLYSDRVFSRIASNYKLLKIFGKDLRILQSLQ